MAFLHSESARKKSKREGGESFLGLLGFTSCNPANASSSNWNLFWISAIETLQKPRIEIRKLSIVLKCFSDQVFFFEIFLGNTNTWFCYLLFSGFSCFSLCFVLFSLKKIGKNLSRTWKFTLYISFCNLIRLLKWKDCWLNIKTT